MLRLLREGRRLLVLREGPAAVAAVLQQDARVGAQTIHITGPVHFKKMT